MLEVLATRRTGAAAAAGAAGEGGEGGEGGESGDAAGDGGADTDDNDNDAVSFLLLDDLKIDEGKNIDLPGESGRCAMPALDGGGGGSGSPGATTTSVDLCVAKDAARAKERSRAVYPLIAALLREDSGGASFHLSGSGCVLHDASGALLMRAGLPGGGGDDLDLDGGGGDDDLDDLDEHDDGSHGGYQSDGGGDAFMGGMGNAHFADDGGGGGGDGIVPMSPSTPLAGGGSAASASRIWSRRMAASVRQTCTSDCTSISSLWITSPVCRRRASLVATNSMAHSLTSDCVVALEARASSTALRRS